MPTLSCKLFGRTKGTQLYGVIFWGFNLGAWFSFLLIKYSGLSYVNAFYFYAGIVVLCIVMILFTKFEIQWGNKIDSIDY